MALTGFLVNNVCHATSAQALVAIQAPYPVVAGSAPFLVSISGATFTAPSTFNLTLKVHSLVGAQEYLLNHLISLPFCDPAIPLNGLTLFDPVLAAGLWMFALTMVLGVWVLAKNAGIIIDMIKRW